MSIPKLKRSYQVTGFSLVELLIIASIIAIVAAIAMPNFLSWLVSRRLNSTFADFEGALKEAQRTAIRSNTNCLVSIDTAANPPTISATPTYCLPSGTRQLRDVTIRTNLSTSSVSGNTVRFGFQGRTSSGGTTVLASSERPNLQRCLVISIGLGLMRVGNYSASDTTGNSAANCTTTQLN